MVKKNLVFSGLIQSTMSSMNILSLSFSSQSNLLLHQPPKFLNPRPHSLLRPQFVRPCQSLKPKILHRPTLTISPNATHSVHSSPAPIDHIHKLLSQKFVIFLLGSFLLMGFTNRRPCLAMPAPDETAQMSEKLVEEDPKNVEALKVGVYAMMRRGKMKTAVKLVKELIKVEPNEVEWRLLEALCYETMGKLSEAKRLLEEILVEKPLLLRALHGLAMVMHKNDEGPAVFEMLKKALELARRENKVTEERNIRILVAQMHVVKGKLDDGLKQFQDLVHDDPRDFRPYLCQGIIYSLLDKKKEAQEQFELYRSLVPDEFPQRGFLDDVVMEAKAKSREQLQKEFAAELSYRK